MPKNKRHYWGVIFIIAILIISGIRIFFLSQEMEKIAIRYSDHINRSQEEKQMLFKEIQSKEYLIEDINQTLKDTLFLYRSLNSSYESLDISYIELKTKTNDTITKIEAYEKGLEESLDWIKSNSQIPQITSTENLKKNLKNHCLDINENTCTIKLGCLFLVNSEFEGLKYIPDQLLSKKDHMQSILEFINNSGGDCEDHAVFFKAEYNFLKDHCKGKDMILESWNDDDTSDHYWLDFNQDWYITEAEKSILPENYIYPNIICGQLFDLRTGKINGHCLVAFTKEKITSSEEIEKLENAPVIEPQDGSFMGNIGMPSSDIFIKKTSSASQVSYAEYEPIKDAKMTGYSSTGIEPHLEFPTENLKLIEPITKEISEITMIITDNDLYLFSDIYEGWLNYYSLLEEMHMHSIALNSTFTDIYTTR